MKQKLSQFLYLPATAVVIGRGEQALEVIAAINSAILDHAHDYLPAVCTIMGSEFYQYSSGPLGPLLIITKTFDGKREAVHRHLDEILDRRGFTVIEGDEALQSYLPSAVA